MSAVEEDELALPTTAWATVTGLSPLRVQRDGDTAPIGVTPDTLVDPLALAVLDRVLVMIADRRLLILGRGGGDQPAVTAAIAAIATTNPAWYSALTAADLAVANRSAFERVVPTAVSVVSGSGSFDSLGKITFAATTQLNVDGVFTSLYQHYFVVWNITASGGGGGAHFRHRRLGTNDVTGYLGSYQESTAGGAWVGNNNTAESRLGRVGTNGASGFCYFYNPFLATVQTRTLGQSSDNDGYVGIGGARLATAKQHDGFSFFAGISLTGTLQVFGVKP